MIWIGAVVLLGLIVVLAQLLLVYQKRSHDLHMKMEPMRRRIRSHRNTMAEMFSKVQERGTGRLTELDQSLSLQGAKLAKAKASFGDLADEEMLQAPAAEDGDGDGVFDEDYDPEREAQASAAREAARELRAIHESLDRQLLELGRDRDVVVRTLERMQSQFGEKAGGAKKRRQKREAAS